MRGHNRTVIKGVPNHCYQNSIDGYLLFYTVSDYLVFYTAFCLEAVRCDVRLLTLCLMPDHFHFTAIADNADKLSSLVGLSTKRYATEFNTLCGTKGSLFKSPYGSVPKIGDKNIRTNIIYVYNNPSERKLTAFAEKYRWNSIAYAKSNHPFSEPIVLNKASSSLRRCLKTVDYLHNTGKHLNYEALKRMFGALDKRESDQLTDYIVCKYSVVDHEEAIRYFGGYENMITAIHSTTGSEHDINEVFVGQRDDCYVRMTNLILKDEGIKDIHSVLSLPESEKYKLYNRLKGRTSATARQIAKFLHLPARKA